ncbi:MAG TPA: hypothetical protein VK559_04515 [Ferruginibacter sp.]|nr:hypothetical protein [Ferruginibacter sp.]
MLIRKLSLIALTSFAFFFIVPMAKAQQAIGQKKDTTAPNPAVPKDTTTHVSVDTTIKHYHQLPKDSLMNPNPPQKDTFFLAKKRGLLGKLGNSIATEPSPETVVKTVNPYLKFAGKTIRSIEFLSIGFDRNINDTTLIRKDLGERIGEAFHRTTRVKVIQHDLLFKEGDHVYPYLLADNERLLRSQPYLSDARILVIMDPESKGAVDVIVITKDVFSIAVTTIDVSQGGFSGLQRGKVIARDENFTGSGSRIQGGVYYDDQRKDQFGYLGEIIRRNIKGSFINWDMSYNNFNGSFSGSGNQETYILSNFDKPLASEFMHWTGGLDLSYRNNLTSLYATNDTPAISNNRTKFERLYKYDYYDVDAWYGYNIGSRNFLYTNAEARYHKFIALRGIDKQFITLPDSVYQNHYEYVSTKAVLGELSVFKQTLYKTTFIYGFGLTEDVPEGFSASLIGGWTDEVGVGRDTGISEQKHERQAPYYGIATEITHFTKKGSYYDITLREGGYSNHGFQDIGVLLNVLHFTRLRKMTPTWFNRFFVTAGFAKQINPDTLLTQPLMLQSQSYGLPRYNYSSSILPTQVRTTINFEADFYNNVKHAGFKFAPFAFADVSVLTPYNEEINLDPKNVYPEVGIGFRTRNDNLIFGTIQVKFYYFLHTDPSQPPYIDVSTNPIFRFNSTFINKPDFVVDN